MLKSRRNSDGFVLVITVLVLSIMFLLAYSFSFSAGVNLAAARNSRDTLIYDHALESALSYAITILQDDAETTKFDSLDEDWTKDKSVIVAGNELEISIVDQDRFLNVNLSVSAPKEVDKDFDRRDVLRRLVAASGGDASDFQRLVQAVSDSQVIFIDELQSINGLQPDLLVAKDGKPALPALLCTHADRINVNTASPAVLQALWLDPEMGRRLSERRSSIPFHDDAEIRDYLATLVGDKSAQLAAPILSAQSACFNVYVTPKTAGASLWALLYRNGRTVKALFVKRLED